MIEVISTKEQERLRAKLKRIRDRSVALDADLMREVAEIVWAVRGRGDAALVDYAERFDNCRLAVEDLRVSRESIARTAARVHGRVLEALLEAIERVRRFHEHERLTSWMIESPNGAQLGQRVSPIERVGVYIPGGLASYPSSVVMNVVPAQVAGVEQIVVTTPPHTIENNPAVAAALVELGIEEVYATGGAQAIAALAYGTETVRAVDKITGPGNRYVAAAKKLVFGIVGIDSLAGPSEVVIIADETSSPSFIASDLLAQAEHDEDASAILITPSHELALAVLNQLAAQAHSLPRAAIIEQSLADFGAIIVTEDMSEACNLVNALAPEHLQLIAADAENIAAEIRHAGAIFLGEQTPTAVGDYLAGPNHVLPTSGAARFSSALSVHDFVKRTSMVKFSPKELQRTAPMIATLARAEGLEAHARSALIRLENN